MKKSIKVLFTVGILGLVMVLGSCKDLWDTVEEAAYLTNSAFTATGSLSNGSTAQVRITFKSDSSTDNHSLLNVLANNEILTGYSWELDPEDLEGARDVIIHNGTRSLRLHTDVVSPRTLTVMNNSFAFGDVTVSQNTVLNKQ